MKIYLFTVYVADGEMIIVQVYATNEVRAKQSVIDVHGCQEILISYHGQDTTTEPLNWLNRYSFKF